MFNANNFLSDEQREKERQDRMDRQNPPSMAHGQSDDGFDNINLDDLFSDSPNNNSNGFGQSGDPFGSFGSSTDNSNNGFGGDGFGNSGFGSGFNTGFNGNPNQQQQQKPAAEDVLFDVMKKGGGGLFSFTKEFVESFKGLDAIFWSKYGNVLFRVSGIVSLFLFLLVMLGKDFLGYMIGSGVSTAIGVLVLAFNNDKARQLKSANSAEFNTNGLFDINQIEGEEPAFDNMFDEKPTSLFEDSDNNGDDPFFDSGLDEEEDEYTDEDDWDFDEEDVTSFETVVEEESDVNTVLQQLNTVPTGMHTRSFLYENYLQVLTKMTPEFSNVIYLSEDDEEWDTYSALIREAQEQMGLDSGDEYDDDLSELVLVEKRLLMIKIEATRPKKLSNNKLADFDRELTNIVSIENGEIVEGRYTKSIISGRKLFITIYLGANATVSVKDAIMKEKEFFLDTANKLPVAMGFDHKGETIKVDLFELESIITAGMPRGGKSYSVKTVLSQAMQFASPKDVNFYFADVKGQLSDWYELRMPHVKRFEGTARGILNLLTFITEHEGERRAKIFRDAGVINYKSYKKKYPESDMPLIFVVIDEMTTLSQELTSQEAQEYKSKLINIVTKMPAYGVKLWGISHVIKNEIIPKTVSDSISCRMSVLGDEAHIETTTGAKPKQFQHKLTNKGDCAVKMPLVQSNVFFMHSFIIAKDDDGVSRVFDYQTELWSKLDPDSVKTSHAYIEAQKSKQDDIMTKLNLKSEVQFDDKGMF